MEAPTPFTPSSPAGKGDFLLTIGDIGITHDQRVVTPNGVAPLAGSSWIVQDNSQTTKETPTWAVVLCVLTALETCGLGLLFLLVKNQKTTGSVQVQVRSEKLFHMTQIPVVSPVQAPQTQQLVRRAQTLAAEASGR
jgi:hypothetical protein